MSQASPVYQGSCLCQGIRYEIKGDIGDIIQCHCQRPENQWNSICNECSYQQCRF